MFWSLAEPLAFMCVLYIVFGIGLRGGRNMDIPFICYLVTGLAVTNSFTQTMSKGTVAVRSHSYLLSKVNIRLSLLPIVTVLTGIVEHAIFLIAVLVILFAHRIFPNIYWIQLLYYLFALSAFLLGICLFVSSVGVFFTDLQNIVGVVGRIVFYFSPVFWDYNLIPESLRFWVRLNPLFYVVMGYRESFFYRIPFWNDSGLMIYFWIWTLGMLLLGIYVFRKLRPQFADFV
jgi:lipopolysaccharide transport system permease protein/teichoic acid transport system permease protein